MTESSGRGDPRRSMELLWELGAGPTRGPKPGLTLRAIVTAAVELADAEGLSALSMRRVAERLGKSAMAIYTYVPGKAELLDLMLDTALGELPTSYPLDKGWRPAVEASARDGWEFYERHPWVLQISGARALLGPHEFDCYESQLRLFDGLGLPGGEIARIVAVVHGFVRGAAKAVSDAATAEQATGLSDDDWWEARAPVLEEIMGDQFAERYPTAARLDAEDHAFVQLDRAEDDDTPYTVRDALDTFEFGLQRLLDGIETYIEARSG
ncbi:MAG: TetR/AcrR family transcriptional regulator [Acidimicrobiales bacterium]